VLFASRLLSGNVANKRIEHAREIWMFFFKFLLTWIHRRISENLPRVVTRQNGAARFIGNDYTESNDLRDGLVLSGGSSSKVPRDPTIAKHDYGCNPEYVE
jgi:hypothetical protein